MKRDDLFAGYEQGQRDMLAKCIALIEESVPWSTENWIAVDERAAILTALRALEEKPTPPPLPPSVGVPEKRWFR